MMFLDFFSKKSRRLESIFLFVILSIGFCSTAQQDSMLVKNAVYAEVFGSAGYGSLNYERFLWCRSHVMLISKMGFSSYKMFDFNRTFNPDVIIPISIQTLLGNTHWMELGVGQTISSIVKLDRQTKEMKRFTHLSTVPSIGYRYQKTQRGMLIRVTYSPIVEFNTTLRHWGGVSWGFTF